MNKLCAKRLVLRLTLTALALCIIPISSPAQGDASTPAPFDDQYHSSWTVRNGAPAALGQVKQTADGFLWLTSSTGLYRFDGIAFTKYRPPAGQRLLKEGPLAALLATADGGLWIAYRFGGASFIRGGKVTNYAATHEFSETVFAFAQRPDGSVWGATDTGLYHFDGARWSRADASWGPLVSHPTHLRTVLTGDLWFDDGTDYYILPHGENHFHKAGLPAGKLDITGTDIGWIGLDNKGLFPVFRRMDGTWTVGKLLLKANISVVTHTPDGSLWFGTHDGIWRIRNINSHATVPLAPGEAQSMRKSDGVTADWVYALTMDREGSIWAITTNGLDQFRKTALASVALPPDMQQLAIMDEGDGNVLVSSSFLTRFLLARITPSEVQAISTPQLTSGIHGMYRDGRGTEWISANGRLYRLKDTRLTLVPGPAGMPADTLKYRAITLDSAGTLWMSIPSPGPDIIYQLTNGQWGQYHGLDSASTFMATSMMTDRAGRVWIGTGASRVFIVASSKVSSYGQMQGVDSGGTTLLQEHGDHVWVGGTENLDYYADGVFRTITYEDGTSMTGVTGVAETPGGDVWLNTARGVLHIALADLQLSLKQPRPRVRSTALSYLDGAFDAPVAHMQSSTVVQSRDGRIYFAGRQGVVSLDPLDSERNAIVPGVFVTSVLVDGRPYESGSLLQIEKGSQNLQINYTATSLLIPERVMFRYKLEGFDRDWQDVGTRRQAYYTHLPPGKYVFLVSARNNDGVWSTVPARWDFSLPPTFLQSMPFKLLCVAAVLALFSSIFLIRLRIITARLKERLYERLAERERIARDLHDTFFQGIQGLFLRFNTGTAMLQPTEPARRIFVEALEQSDRVMAEGRELVLDLRAEETVSGGLAEDLARVDMKSYGVAHPAYQVSAIGQVRRLHPVSGSELLRIGLEAVHNALKHANATAVEVEIVYEKDFLKLRIRDDGKGIDDVVLRNGRRPGHLGLVGMNERAERIGARYRLWSKLGQGTEIEVEVPARIAYASRYMRCWRPIGMSLWAPDRNVSIGPSNKK